MRGVLFLLILVGGIYLGASYFGGSADPKDASAAGGEQASPTADDLPVQSDEDVVAGDSGDHQATEEVPARSGPLDDIVRQLSRAAVVDPTDPALKALLDTDPRGSQVRDALSAEPATRWLGLSRLYASANDESTRKGLLEQVLAASRNGAKSVGLSEEYVVVGGDSLYKICDRMKKKGVLVTPGMLRWVNGLSGDRIFPKQSLRVPTGAPRITVSKAGFHLRLWLGEGLVREYAVGLGKEGRTPTADFVIDSRLIEAPWPNPETGKVLNFGDPGYAIGTRWLGFDDDGPHKGFGIHGTDQPETIGQEKSLGCVRLRNAEVEELFELVPEGTKVTIR